MYTELKEALQAAAYKALGQEEESLRKTTPEWWNSNIEGLVAEKKVAYSKWLMTRERKDREKYIHTRRETNKAINTAKNETW
jgi:hypothetical protein